MEGSLFNPLHLASLRRRYQTHFSGLHSEDGDCAWLREDLKLCLDVPNVFLCFLAPATVFALRVINIL